MKTTITATVDVDAMRIFRTKYDNVSKKVESLIKADVDYKEEEHKDLETEISNLKSRLAEAIDKKMKQEEEKKAEDEQMVNL